MTFEEVLNQALAMLQRQGRVSYRALKRQFSLDDAYLEDLKLELIEVHQMAVDQDGTMLVWTGGSTPASVPAAPPASTQEREPLSHTPSHLAEKILMSRSALEGERKQVTVTYWNFKRTFCTSLTTCRAQLAGAYSGRSEIQRRSAGETLRVMPMWQREQEGDGAKQNH